MTFYEVVEIVAKVLSIIGFMSVIFAPVAFFSAAKKKKFEEVYNKIPTAKSNSTKICFSTYSKKLDGILDEKSTSLLVAKSWALNGGVLLPLNDVEVRSIEMSEKAQRHMGGPAPLGWKYLFYPVRHYVNELMRYGLVQKDLYNGDIYCAASYEPNTASVGRPVLTVYPSEYFYYYNTCKVKEFMYESGQRYFIKKDVFDLENRACGIGVNTLTVIRLGPSNDDLYFLMYDRCDNPEKRIDAAIGVIPSGSYQPFDSFPQDQKEEASGEESKKQEDTVPQSEKATTYAVIDNKVKGLTWMVYRNFCEKVFCSAGKRTLSIKSYLTEDDGFCFLTGSTIKNKCISEVYYLGVGLNPYNTRMETMSLLYLDLTDPASFQTFLRLLDPTGNTSADSDGAIDKLRFVLKQVKNEDGEILAEPLKGLARIAFA